MKTILLIFLFFLFIFSANAQTKHLWCTTSTGGTHGWGTILEGDSNGGNFHEVYSFDQINGSYPLGKLVQGNNGLIYGATLRGGANNSCILFAYNPTSGLCTKIYDFDANSQYGSIPYGGLIRASDGKFYGTCNQGGANYRGCLYKLDPSNNAYSDIYDFIDSTGYGPLSELLQANNGNFYAMAYEGGVNNNGTLFRFNATTNQYKAIHYFTYATGYMIGYCTLVQASNNKIYGVTQSGGANGNGVIFSIDPATDSFKVVYNFSYNNPSYTYFYGTPWGSLTQATNGKLYGMTLGDQSPFGEIFSFDILNDSLTVVKTFDSLSGYHPDRSLTRISNGKYVGTTKKGGAHNYGVIFSFDVTTNAYVKLLDLDSTNTGSYPTSDILESNTSITGLKDEVMNEINVFPNPSNNLLIVQGIDIGQPIIITNILGEGVIKTEATGNSNQIDISHLQPGMYFVNRIKIIKE